VLRLAAVSGILDILQSGGMDAEDLLHLERFGYEPSPKARKRSKASIYWSRPVTPFSTLTPDNYNDDLHSTLAVIACNIGQLCLLSNVS
jgi:hypothetical protein